ncbi:GMC family oxidoreductase [Novosphingobium sp.]|uniref:GMC family oxidoreductase n=1 Tax=Novosphingobium sp. TaxID=1874826 RepID=UPI0025FD57FB|nr:GMC family oxidoreductase [Novosphingobium sp.]
MKLPFDDIQRRFLLKFGEALFDDYAEMAIPVEAVVERFEVLIARIGGTKADEVSFAIYAANLALGPFFDEVSVDTRKDRIRNRMQDTHSHFFHELGRIRGIMYLSYYSHWEPAEDGSDGQDENRTNPVHQQIGFTLPKFRQGLRGPGDVPVPIDVTPGREIDAAHFVNAATIPHDIDIVVVGSGAGGAIAALNLSRHYKVLVIEAGPYLRSDEINHEEGMMTARLYKHGALQTTANNDIVVFQARNVGGGPTINNGISLRAKGDVRLHPDAPDVFAKWAEIGAPIDEARFMAAYQAVEDLLEIKEIEHRSSRSNGPHLLNGWAKFLTQDNDPVFHAAKPGWFRKNFGPSESASPCGYCGYCNTGCPYARKVAMGTRVLPRACAEGAKILAETKVEKILWARNRNNGGPSGQPSRAIGVTVTDRDGIARVIPVRVGVVVAAGTIASSLLLARSGIDGTGEQISLNIASPVTALMPEDVMAGKPSWDEDQMATMVDCKDFMLESHFQAPMTMSALMPGWFGEMDRRMRHYSCIVETGILFAADRLGRISGGKLDMRLTEEELVVVRRAMVVATKMHFADGAIEVWPALSSGRVVYPHEDFEAVYAEEIQHADDITLSSAHPHGGNPMHADPHADNSVVDLDCRVHGTSNVLVTDASVFPSCIRVNAQLTTMAMAQYATGQGDPFAGIAVLEVAEI